MRCGTPAPTTTWNSHFGFFNFCGITEENSDWGLWYEDNGGGKRKLKYAFSNDVKDVSNTGGFL
jgi:hypothetical protein